MIPKNASDRHKEYWIKPSSVKTVAKGAELSELFDKFNSTPYDDRVSRKATIDDIRRGHLEDFLRDANSSLLKQINTMPMEDMLVALEVANLTDAGIDIRNIGLLMFADSPDKFLPGAHIELIHFHTSEAEASNDFTEKNFTGPIQKQIRDALSYIRAVLLTEKVVKHPHRAEADRFWNYPYAALEEILVNSVFHKSYRDQEPVEIRIYTDYIQVINYPGPEKWINMEKFAIGKVRARKSRNRRIGEFLKEIDLSEKKSTGITKILESLKANGSPLPEFETDDERNYLIVTVYQHKGFEGNGADTIINDPINDLNDPINGLNDPINDLNDPINDPINQTQKSIMSAIKRDNNATYEKLANEIGVSTATIKRYLKKLSEIGLIKRVGSKKDGHWEIV